MKTFFIRVNSLIESPHSWDKVPIERTLVEKVEKDYVPLDYRNHLKEKYKRKGYTVLWIYEARMKII